VGDDTAPQTSLPPTRAPFPAKNCVVSFITRDPFDTQTTVQLEGLERFDDAMACALISAARLRGVEPCEAAQPAGAPLPPLGAGEAGAGADGAGAGAGAAQDGGGSVGRGWGSSERASPRAAPPRRGGSGGASEGGSGALRLMSPVRALWATGRRCCRSALQAACLRLDLEVPVY
jgi:hypothetical protein